MNHSLRRKLSSYLVLSAFLSAMCISLGLWIFGELHFRAYYAASEREGLESVRVRLALFDTILARAEQDVLGPGRQALLSLGSRFSSREEILRLGTTGLADLAKELGVGDIYFIGADGRVFASSFAFDIGLDLFSLGPRFAESLKTLYGQGAIGDQRLSQSTKTGVLTVYQYFGPAGRNFLIEVSTPIDSVLSRLYTDRGYAGLVDLAFRSGKDGGFSNGTVRLVDLIGESGSTLWSLLEVGKTRDEYTRLIKMARDRSPVRVEAGGIETAAFMEPLSGAKSVVVHDRRFAIIEIDRRPLIRYRWFTLLTLVISCGAALAVSFMVANRGFARHFAVRVENLEKAMARVAERAAPFDCEDSVGDEISSIVRGVDSLVRQVRKRAEEREALNAQLSAEVDARAKREAELARALSEQLVLQREIQHRVKNNMQIVLSLVGLQAGAADNAAVALELESTRTRLYAMSMVLDRLYARQDVERLPLDDFLRDYSYYLDGVHRRPGFFATIRTDGGGLFLAADAAVPVGLIIGELLSNALDHAFPGLSSGRVEVVAAAAEEGFTLTVSDDGVGGRDSAEGVGLTIVRALAAQLGASFSMTAARGRSVRLEFSRGTVEPPAGR